MERRHAPVEPVPGRLVGARERRADHHGVGAAGDRLGEVAAVAHPAVGDHLAVVARLEHVLGAGRRDVGDRGGLRHADPQHAARGARRARADADQHGRRAGPHQVQPGVIARAAAHHDRDRQLADELLEVEHVPLRGDVLGRDDRALDHEDVEPGVERELVVALHALRRERRRGDDPLVLDLADALDDQLLADGLLVDLLHLARGLFAVEAGDPLQLRLGVLVARPDALEVEHAEAAEAADDPGRLGRHHAVHRRGQQRQLEPVGPERPRHVDVVRIPRPPRGNDRDVVESVGAARLLASADLYFHGGILGAVADGKSPDHATSEKCLRSGHLRRKRRAGRPRPPAAAARPGWG